MPPNSKYSIVGYWENESGERLQLFLVDLNSISISSEDSNVLHSRKDHHISLFKLGLDFIKKSLKRGLEEEIQDSDPLAILYHKLGNSTYVDQIDVIEIILISTSISVETRGKENTPKRFLFDDEVLKTRFQRERESFNKEILIQKKLIDISYLYQVSISQGNIDPLIVSFQDTFGTKIEVIKAATEENFESFLCVLPASGIAKLYRKESSRLLEKNVRSFLNFKVEANKEMRKTIINAPEKFIAYNNGLTITGSERDLEEINGRFYINSITDFQIVNGGQTTAGIYFSFKDGLDISKINLMAKINIAKDVSIDEMNELITNISRYSNTQTKVSKVDLKTSNNELKTIKKLSRSIFPPNQNKWFFDLQKGEFTTLAKLNNKKKFEKEYPKQRRFSKEQLGKYYTAWGLKPFLVKLGGVKVFRFFIEEISGDGEKKKPKVIDRDFYETLIARVILFRELETLHGAGKYAIGQLRSAVIPYSMSAIYLNMNADKKKPDFNLELLWNNQNIDDFMKSYFTELMNLINELIKKYAQSDDYGTYSKKEQLWKDISKSIELKKFFESENSLKFIEKYGIPKSKNKKKDENHEVDFTIIQKTVKYAALEPKYFKDLLKNIDSKLSNHMENKVLGYVKKLKAKKDIGEPGIKVLDELISHVQSTQPSLLNHNKIPNENIIITLDKIINVYNKAKSQNKSVLEAFKTIKLVAQKKKTPYCAVFDTIGKKLEENNSILLSEIYHASNFYNIKNKTF